MKKFFNSLREHAKNVIDFEKKNGSTNKRRIKIVSTYKSILYLWIKVKIAKKSEIIVTIQMNIEVQHIVFIIKNLTCLMNFL